MAASDPYNASFSRRDITLALLLAVVVEVGVVLTLSGMDRRDGAAPAVQLEPQAIPIAVNPVMEEPKFLKKGSKKKARLPTLNRKPVAKERFEDRAAPSVQAEKEIDELPKTELAKHDEEPPPKDAELAKHVDKDVEAEKDPKPVEMNQEGHEDGIDEGTELDPLKAHVVSQYRLKVIAWFKAGFVLPTEIDDATLCSLNALASNVIGGDGTFRSYTLSSSGNAVFDARVRATLDRKIGQQLPPPPPKYPEVLSGVVTTRFSGQRSSCK